MAKKKEKRSKSQGRDTKVSEKKSQGDKKSFKEKWKNKTRYAEILGVFAKHNFYSNGFVPEELRTTLEDLGPTYVKIGQIMSSKTNLLPEEYCRELAKLRSSVEPLDSAVARRVIEEETGKRIDEIYLEFRDEPLGSASIAQAHFGILKGGTKVVTKVQRPDVGERMHRDFEILKKIAGFVGVAANPDSSVQAVDLKLVITELEKVSEEELDFRIEAKNTRDFCENCIDDDTVISCPTIIEELSTEHILTMTYVEGFSLANKERLDAENCDRKKIGEAIVENFVHQIFDVGMFHGDPHQGNIMISAGVPYWIDFGMIGRISEKGIDSIQSLLMAIIQEDAEGLADAALTVGKHSGSIDHEKLVEDAERLIKNNFTGKGVAGSEISPILTEIIDILARHEISVPREYTMLIRSIITIEGVIVDLCPELNLLGIIMNKLFEKAKEDFDIKKSMENMLKSVVTTGYKSLHYSTAVLNLLKNLSKGRIKLRLELSDEDEFLGKVNKMIFNFSLIIIACVIFLGSCLLCLADISPLLVGIPWPAFAGITLSAALAIYSIGHFWKKR